MKARKWPLGSPEMDAPDGTLNIRSAKPVFPGKRSMPSDETWDTEPRHAIPSRRSGRLRVIAPALCEVRRHNTQRRARGREDIRTDAQQSYAAADRWFKPPLVFAAMRAMGLMSAAKPEGAGENRVDDGGVAQSRLPSRLSES